MLNLMMEIFGLGQNVQFVNVDGKRIMKLKKKQLKHGIREDNVRNYYFYDDIYFNKIYPCINLVYPIGVYRMWIYWLLEHFRKACNFCIAILRKYFRKEEGIIID